MLIDNGDYFAINRARQNVKITTIDALAEYLKKDYIVISLDFQLIGDAKFKSEHVFYKGICKLFKTVCKRQEEVVDYPGGQFVIELKIWDDQKYHVAGGRQTIEYLDYFGLKKRYMVAFNFNKRKETGVREDQYGDYTLIEAIV